MQPIQNYKNLRRGKVNMISQMLKTNLKLLPMSKMLKTNQDSGATPSVFPLDLVFFHFI